MTFDRDNEMDLENRVIAPEYVPEDAEVENPLRPRTFADYVGQEKVKENLEVFIPVSYTHLYTDAETMDIVQQVLAGKVNKAVSYTHLRCANS